MRAASAALQMDPSVSEIRGLIDRFTVDMTALGRLYPVSFSPARSARMKAHMVETTKALQAVNFEGLDDSGKIDWLLFRNHLQFERDQLGHAQIKADAIADLLPFAPTIIQLEEDRRGLTAAQRPRESAGLIAGVEEQVKVIQSQLAATIDSTPTVQQQITGRRAATAVDELRRALLDWNEYYAEWSPEWSWWLRQPVPAADAALAGYAAFLREHMVGQEEGTSEPPVIGDPIGRDALLAHLEHELIPYSPEELVTMAEQEWEWVEAEMQAVATTLGFDGDWNAALHHVSHNVELAEPGGQPGVIKALAEEAIVFLEERGPLVTIPPLAKEVWRMEMMSVARQIVNPFCEFSEHTCASWWWWCLDVRSQPCRISVLQPPHTHTYIHRCTLCLALSKTYVRGCTHARSHARTQSPVVKSSRSAIRRS